MTRRLVVGFGGCFIVMTLLSAIVFYSLLKSQLKSERELILRDRLQAIATLLRSAKTQLKEEASEQAYAELRERIEREWPLRGGEKFFVRLDDGKGKVLISTPKMPKLDELPGYLVRNELLPTGAGEIVRVIAAIGEEQSSDFLATLRETLLAVLSLNILVSLFVGRQIVRLEMRPLGIIAARVLGITSQTLHERIEVDTLPIELQTLALAFNSTFDRLSTSFERLSRFSSDVAHELRTPLSNAMGSMEVALARSRTIEDYRDVLESGLEECGRISRICDNLLFLARAENQHQPLVPAAYRPRVEIAKVVEFLEPLASEKKIAIEVAEEQAGRFESSEILLDGALLERVLVNLIANAIHYTPTGGKVRIGYSLFDSQPRSLILTVADNGVGIPKHDLPYIFDRFYRVDRSRHSQSGGVGLGLSIVRGIVDLHGGSIKVESEMGVGTTFRIDLPETQIESS